MKHNVVLKFIAILLAACALVVAAGSAVGVVLLEDAHLYSDDFTDWKENIYVNRSERLAQCMAESYSARVLSDLTQEQLDYIGWDNSAQTISNWCDIDLENWCYTICDTAGNVLESNYDRSFSGISDTYQISTSVSYPVLSSQSAVWNESYYYWDGSTETRLYIRDETSPEFIVTVWMVRDSITSYNGISLELYQQLAQIRYYLICFIAAGLLLGAICLVYLFCAAGRTSQGAEPSPGGLNRLPLDLYAAAAFSMCFLLLCFMIEVTEDALYYSSGYNIGSLTFIAIAALGFSVIVIGFLFALAAQCKMPNFYWLHHSVIGWCLGKLWRGIRIAVKAINRLFNMLPLIWQYLLIAAAMVLIPVFFLLLTAVSYGFGQFFWLLLLAISLLADIAIVCHGAYAYGTLLKGAQRMAEGTLYAKISTKYLFGSYARCAQHLNALADVATVAAKQQLRSERMKTELITNVSHDIKTPLTSIINYVDLLEKPHSPEEGAQYLEVLGRQSQRLKKLIDDLMEMSKATTGNMAVEIAQVDAAEAVNQALGEFADKLALAQLQPIFRQPDSPVTMFADGRLTWRVLSNLLSNIVKYALPGTRVYIDMVKLDGCVLISLKNISREELNVSADELTERFVRGDVSRNTEGSGLGLNIAKSLMELQKGQLQLLVDGDLFKVTLVFPAA